MENLSEDEALPNYSYQPPYNLHGLIDIAALQQHYAQPDNQSHHLHNTALHPTNEIPATHIPVPDYTNQNYNLPHNGGYVDGQNVPVYPTTISPVPDQLGLPSNMGNSWQTPGMNKLEVGRWSETRNQSQHRVEVGGIGWTDQLNKSMHRLMEVDVMCDMILVSSTNQIKVHKLIIASSSDYLLTLLKRYDHFKMLQINIPMNISMEALKTFVTFLYLGKADLTSENIQEVAMLANLFKIQVLKDLIIKLSGDQDIGQDDKLCELQLLVLEFYDKRDECIDTGSLVGTTEQGINTDVATNINIQPLPPQISNDITDILGEDFFCTKKIQKKGPLTPPHTYGTRSTAALKGTPKSRRKTYIEEITKQDLEAQNKAVVSDTPTDTPKDTKEVYRGKKSRLLAGALTNDSHETPKTRGKAKRKLDIANTNSQNVAPQVPPLPDPVIDEQQSFDDGSVGRKTRQRKPSVGGQVPAVRPPPKKRAKMALQLSLDDLFNDLTYVDACEDENVCDETTDAVDEPEVPEDPKTTDETTINSESPQTMTKTTKKSKKSKRSRMARWKKSKNIMGIATDVESMAEHIPEAERQFKCTLCGNEFVFSKRCISHMMKTHDVGENEIISNIIIRSKSETDPKICDICGYKTKDQNFCYIHYHKYFKHGVPLPKGWKVYKCDECGKECFTKFMLKDHKLTHIEETPFICETCGNGFKSRTCLNSHVLHRHSEVKKHPCPNCTKTFKTRTQMNVHFRTHTGEKPFSCPRCDYKSTTRGNMRLHLTNRHKMSTEKVKSIMDNMVVTEPPMVVSDEKAVPSIPMQFIAVENAEIKASLQIDGDMKWTPITELADQTNLNSVTPTILLPISQSDQTTTNGTSYRTFTILPSSVDGTSASLSVPIELLNTTDSQPTVATMQPVSMTQMSQSNTNQLYMQHSPISPAPAISPEVSYKQSNITSSPITTPSVETSYQTQDPTPGTSMTPESSTYSNYSRNIANSPISPAASTSETYQSLNNSQSQPASILSQDLPGQNDADITQMLKLDPNFNQQNYDTTFLQVYNYQNHLYTPM